jgi:hypothetical protein
VASRPAPSRRARTALLAAVPALILGSVVTAPAAATPTLEPAADAPSIAEVVAANPQAEQVDARTVEFDGGAVVLTYPAAAQDGLAKRAAASSASCPSGWYCLYDGAGWSGRMLQFRDCGVTQSLHSYGFARSASSWANKRSRSVYVYAGGSTIWASYAGQSAYSVDAGDNDRADAVRLGC